MTTPAGIWVRVSTGGQDEASQLPDIERHCTDRGYAIARRYELNDRSAWKGEQDAKLAEMLADVKAGRIKALVCWHSDRLERRGVEALFRLLREVREAGGQVESVKEPNLGAADVGSEATTAFSAIMARQESAQKSERVRLAHDRIRAAGALNGRPPWGYVATGEKYSRKLVPTPEGRKYVPQIFQRYADGESLQDIADTLPGRRWAKSVAGVIRNSAYAGYRRDGEGRIVHHCEPLVDAALWRRANDRLDGSHKRGTARKASTALLTSVLFCAACGGESPMYRIMSGHGQSRKPCYRCTGRGAGRQGCGTMVDLAWLDAEVEDRMSADPWPVTESRLVPGQNHEAEIEAIRLGMRALAAEDLDDGEHDRRLAGLRAERDRLRSLPSVPDRWETVELDFTRGQEWDAADHEGKRAILLGALPGRLRWKITFRWKVRPDGGRSPVIEGGTVRAG